MTAIITDPLKRQLTQTIFNEVTAQTARYYIGIGRSEAWDSAETVPTPIDNPRSIRNARASMQSIKTAGDVTFTIPRYNWSSGAIYNGYDWLPRAMFSAPFFETRIRSMPVFARVQV